MFDIQLVNSTYDDLANKVKTDLDEQFTLGRLTGSDYANVYATLMNTILQLAFQTPEKEQQIALQQQQVINAQAQEELIKEQTQVASKQVKSFDQNIQLKLFKAQMDTWGVMFGSGMLTDKPNIITNDQVSSLYQQIKNSIN